jgi:uncharacterized protein (DUF849 family)
MKPRERVIITCAVTGSVHTPTMSNYLPITPDEVAREAIAAAEAGAAVLHLHARDPKDGRPTPDPGVFGAFLPRIKQSTDAVVNITTGGGPGMTLDERLAAPLKYQPELASLNMGPISLGLFPLADRYQTWKQPWEQEFLRATKGIVFNNSFEVVEGIVERLGKGCGTRFEFECYDIGHLYTLAHFLDRKVVEPPLFVQSIFGLLGGIGADESNLLHMRTMADRLFGEDYHWSILAAGKHQMRLGTIGALMGGHVRVGLEDSLYLAKGVMAKSNAEQVAKIRRILAELSLETASPAEAREMLNLKGGDAVAF